MRLLFVTLFLLVSACAHKPVVDYNPAYDFSAVESFAWVSPNIEDTDGPKVSEFAADRIAQAVTADLQSKGLTQAAPEAADVLVTFILATDTEQHAQTTTYSISGPGWHRGPWGVYGGAHSSRTRVYDVPVGTIVIEVFDRAEDQLVWHSSLGGRLDDGNDPQERSEAVKDTVTLMMEQFPPQS